MRFGSGTCLGSQVFRSRWASVSAFTLCTIATLTLFVTVWRVSCGRVSCGWVSCGRVCCVHLLRLTTEGPPRTNDRLKHTASAIVSTTMNGWRTFWASQHIGRSPSFTHAFTHSTNHTIARSLIHCHHSCPHPSLPLHVVEANVPEHGPDAHLPLLRHSPTSIRHHSRPPSPPHSLTSSCGPSRFTRTWAGSASAPFKAP